MPSCFSLSKVDGKVQRKKKKWKKKERKKEKWQYNEKYGFNGIGGSKLSFEKIGH